MIGKDYCRCPGCGQCDAAEEVERLREVLVRIGNEARDLKTVKAMVRAALARAGGGS